MSSGLLTVGVTAGGGGGGGAFSLPRSIPGNVFAEVLKGRVVFKLLDQMELLNGVVVVDHRPLGLPRID